MDGEHPVRVSLPRGVWVVVVLVLVVMLAIFAAQLVLQSDVGSATRAGRDLAVSLLRAGAGQTLQDLSSVLGELQHKQRLERFLVRGLHAERAATETAGLTRRLLDTQVQALAVARQ